MRAPLAPRTASPPRSPHAARTALAHRFHAHACAILNRLRHARPGRRPRNVRPCAGDTLPVAARSPRARRARPVRATRSASTAGSPVPHPVTCVRHTHPARRPGPVRRPFLAPPMRSARPIAHSVHAHACAILNRLRRARPTRAARSLRAAGSPRGRRAPSMRAAGSATCTAGSARAYGTPGLYGGLTRTAWSPLACDMLAPHGGFAVRRTAYSPQLCGALDPGHGVLALRARCIRPACTACLAVCAAYSARAGPWPLCGGLRSSVWSGRGVGVAAAVGGLRVGERHSGVFSVGGGSGGSGGWLCVPSLRCRAPSRGAVALSGERPGRGPGASRNSW